MRIAIPIDKKPASGAGNKNASGGGAALTKLEVYVTDEVLRNHRGAFAKMPSDVQLYVVRKGKAPYRLKRNGDSRTFSDS